MLSKESQSTFGRNIPHPSSKQVVSEARNQHEAGTSYFNYGLFREILIPILIMYDVQFCIAVSNARKYLNSLRFNIQASHAR
jgi:hypothetical protein